MKRLVMTGGRGGIGSAFVSRYGDCYDIRSLSRRSGHDIVSHARILPHILGADIFVNLASTQFDHQSILLHHCYNMWRAEPDKIILNIGSCSGLDLRFPDTSPEGPWLYASSKSGLYNLFHQCLQDHINHRSCRVKMLTIGPTNAGPNLGRPNTLDPNTVADEMYRLLTTPSLYHSVLL